MMKNRKFFIYFIIMIFLHLGVFNATSTEQDITLNNPTSFPVDI